APPAPAGAEVQGHADERDLLHVAGRVLFIVPAGNSVKVDAMGAPPPTRKTAPVSVASPAEPSVDVLPILVTRKVLTTEQAERVRRATRMGGQTTAHAIIQLGFANEVQIA